MRNGTIIIPVFLLMLVPAWLLLFNKGHSGGSDHKNKNDLLVETGRYLFFDTRLSYNNTKSCGSCHDPAMAFTDGYRSSSTASGDNVKHNAPSLINVSFHSYFDWANPGVTQLTQQHERPLFNEHPVELGAKGNESIILKKLKTDPRYQKIFARAFPRETDPFHFNNVITAIASFVNSLRSFQSPYDRYTGGDSNALSIQEKTGMALFFSSRLHCAECHKPPLFTAASLTRDLDSIYFNTGLYNVGNKNRYPSGNNGLYEYSGKPADDGRYKTPSLRNVALTAPYMHDGSMANLEEVINAYARGGRRIEQGPLSGDGQLNNCKDKRISGFSLTGPERLALISFLYSLTDSSILTNPAFQNPFTIKDK
ncbi:MAG: di-heme enzyme [Chitinophagaceae bacterium]|nr:di-heme enzyme [Chitinophagaceae bacterium]